MLNFLKQMHATTIILYKYVRMTTEKKQTHVRMTTEKKKIENKLKFQLLRGH